MGRIYVVTREARGEGLKIAPIDRVDMHGNPQVHDAAIYAAVGFLKLLTYFALGHCSEATTWYLNGSPNGSNLGSTV